MKELENFKNYLLKENLISELQIPQGLSININKKTGIIDMYSAKEYEDEVPFSEFKQMAEMMRNFISQLPEGQIIGDIMLYGGIEGLGISCKFSTSLSKEELMAMGAKNL